MFNAPLKRKRIAWIVTGAGLFGVGLALGLALQPASKSNAFPAEIPANKPSDRALSAAMHRLYDQWGPETAVHQTEPSQDDHQELFTSFRYSRLEGLDYSGNITRRDPSKVLKIGDTYYVWYTRRHTESSPLGPEKATDTVPSFDWDLAEIWYATSKDGFTWREQGVAVPRPPKPRYGWRSVSTPDVLAFGSKFYLYYQGFNEVPGKRGDRAATTVSEADSPEGPWRPLGRVVVDFGEPVEWDGGAIHDPYPLVFNGRIYLYYKGQPQSQVPGVTIIRAQGLAIADHPLGPFEKHPLNPVLNSGHETGLFPWRGGIAAIASLDGPEKNTVQYAPDGVNFRLMSIVELPPIAPGPFVPDAFADNRDGRGITWGLCHIPPDEGGFSPAFTHFTLARFDCDLNREIHRPGLKTTYPHFNEDAYFQRRAALSAGLRKLIQAEREQVDHETVLPER